MFTVSKSVVLHNYVNVAERDRGENASISRKTKNHRTSLRKTPLNKRQKNKLIFKTIPIWSTVLKKKKKLFLKPWISNSISGMIRVPSPYFHSLKIIIIFAGLIFDLKPIAVVQLVIQSRYMRYTEEHQLTVSLCQSCVCVVEEEEID